MKLFIMQFYSSSSYFFPLRSKYPPQHSVLRHPQSTSFSQGDRPSFTLVQNNTVPETHRMWHHISRRVSSWSLLAT
jgi:hypothetical protein